MGRFLSLRILQAQQETHTLEFFCYLIAQIIHRWGENSSYTILIRGRNKI